METPAYCGLVCETCPIYQATRIRDRVERDRLRAKIAQQLRLLYGLPYGPADVTDCEGCRTENGRLFSGRRDCRIRACARTRGVSTCADCRDYPCTTLFGHFSADPTARTRLDHLRAAASRPAPIILAPQPPDPPPPPPAPAPTTAAPQPPDPPRSHNHTPPPSHHCVLSVAFVSSGRTIMKG